MVNFYGPLVFCAVARYHGGAYVVFSKRLNPGLKVLALQGSFASVIGAPAAAAVVFAEEARALALKAPRLVALQEKPLDDFAYCQGRSEAINTSGGRNVPARGCVDR